MANLEVKFPVSRDTIAVAYLSQVVGIDTCTALYLHDKYKEDFFFFFYMLCGKKISFPDVDSLVRSRKASNLLYRNITTSNYTTPELIRDKDALAYIESHLSGDRENIVFTYTPDGESVKFQTFFNEESINKTAEVLHEGPALQES